MVTEEIGGSSLLFAAAGDFASAVVAVDPSVVIGKSDLLALARSVVLVNVSKRIANHRRGVDAGKPVQSVVSHGGGAVVLEGNLAYKACSWQGSYK